MAKRGRITVKHYLNDRLKPLDKNRYPIYLQITLLGKTTQVKSLALIPYEYYVSMENIKFDYSNHNLAQGYATKNEFNNLMNDKQDWIYKKLKREQDSIRAYFEYLNPFEKNEFSLSGFKTIYSHMSNVFVWDYEGELRDNLCNKVQTSDYFPLSNLIYTTKIDELYKAFDCIKESAKCTVPAIEFIISDLELIVKISKLIKRFTDGVILFSYELFIIKEDLLKYVQESEINKMSNNMVYKNLQIFIQNRISRYLKEFN